MLVYIRQDQLAQILESPSQDEVPRLLSDKLKQEATLLNQMQKDLDVHIDAGVVYLISPETVALNWTENK